MVLSHMITLSLILSHLVSLKTKTAACTQLYLIVINTVMAAPRIILETQSPTVASVTTKTVTEKISRVQATAVCRSAGWKHTRFCAPRAFAAFPANAWLRVVVHLHPVIRYLILLHFVLLHLVYVLPQQFVVTNTAPVLVPIFQTIPV